MIECLRMVLEKVGQNAAVTPTSCAAFESSAGMQQKFFQTVMISPRLPAYTRT